MNLNKAERLATDLIKYHLGCRTPWTFAWNNRKTALGVCLYGSRQIQLSRTHTAGVSDAEVLDTILHEIAHALTPGHNHDAVWQRKAREIGGTGNRVASESADLSEHYTWEMYDTRTGRRVKGYHRKPRQSTFEDVHLYGLKSDPTAKGKLALRRVNTDNDVIKNT